MPGKQISVAHAVHGGPVFGNADPCGTGYEGADQVRVVVIMFTQQGKRIMVTRVNQTLDISGDYCRRIATFYLESGCGSEIMDIKISLKPNYTVKRLGHTITSNLDFINTARLPTTQCQPLKTSATSAA
jgi:hypothetical protein